MESYVTPPVYSGNLVEIVILVFLVLLEGGEGGRCWMVGVWTVLGFAVFDFEDEK